jgi:hypothetical protein
MTKTYFKDNTFDQAAKEYHDSEYLVPTEDKIGIFTADDVGAGDFRWIKDTDELKYFILNIWIPTLTEYRDKQYYQFIEKVKEQLEKNELTLSEIQELLNNSPYPDTEIKWMGTINMLIKDEGFFAEQVKDHFNENKPLDDSNRSDFIAFLKDYVWA